MLVNAWKLCVISIITTDENMALVVFSRYIVQSVRLWHLDNDRNGTLWIKIFENLLNNTRIRHYCWKWHFLVMPSSMIDYIKLMNQRITLFARLSELNEGRRPL